MKPKIQSQVVFIFLAWFVLIFDDNTATRYATDTTHYALQIEFEAFSAIYDLT